MISAQQIPLQFTTTEPHTFSHFFDNHNDHTLKHLMRMCQNSYPADEERFIYLWGTPQSGRTHLLKACCHEINQQGGIAAYLPGKNAQSLNPRICNNLENNDLVCIDDIDLILTTPLWEESLFHLFNKIRENNTRLVITANSPPSQLPMQLADLQSRLSWGLVYKIQPLEDQDKLTALLKRAQVKGLSLSQEAGEFMLSHMPRDLPSLFNTLNILDQASLTHQRKLTIPFIKSVLNIQ